MPTPLGELKILDLSRQLPGPFCSSLLADLGADVVVIANPRDPFGVGIPSLCRNKRSMKLNLKSKEGREIFLALAAEADVLLEGFRPGVSKRLGIDYETLRANHPRLIYCAISGYGQDGPYRDKVGHDVNYLGYAGVLEFIGEPTRAPVIPGVQIADIGAGSLMGTIGILAAVIARQQTGRGQFVDVAMFDGAVAWNVYAMLLQQLGQNPQRGSTEITGHFPCYSVYETRDGRYVTVGAFEAPFWATLCRHFGRADFIDKQWDEGAARREIFEFFHAAFLEKTLDEWQNELGGEDICFGPVNTVEDVYQDPQLRHRGMIVETSGPAGSEYSVGTPIQLSDTPATIRSGPFRFGEHTEEILESLGYDREKIQRLRDEGVI